MNRFSNRLAAEGLQLRRARPEILQINVGKLCNLTCAHCHVNAERGEGVFEGSIKALQLLNSLGYGYDPELRLHLVYNPVGASLPGSQAELETDYKRELSQHFGIIFNNLYAVTNLPIGRFAS